MHRLLSARNLYPGSFNGFTLPSNNVLKLSDKPERKCTFCQRSLGPFSTENVFHIRQQSTKAANILQKSSKRKIKYKNYKKYGELMEVGDKSMTETKISISKFKAVHLTKLASSSVSLGQLHQLTTKNSKLKPTPAAEDVDPELLQLFREKILKTPTKVTNEANLENDKCALLFTSHNISTIEDKLRTQQYLNMVKESYYNFRKTTLYDQRLSDLKYAISEGLHQEFNVMDKNSDNNPKPDFKSPHAVFKELFFDVDHALISHVNYQSQAIAHPAIEDLYDDSILNNEVSETIEEIKELDSIKSVKSLKIKKSKEALLAKRKHKKEQLRTAKERSMKNDLEILKRNGKQEALQNLLKSHLKLLCSLNMLQEGHQILQYYRNRSNKPNHAKVTDIEVYNVLLHGYAAKGQYENVLELLEILQQDGIKLNAQSYAAIFEAIERNSSHRLVFLLKHYELMKQQNISLNDLFDKCKFLKDQREVILSAVRRIERDFVPKYTPPDLDYVCPLMERLKLYNGNREGLKLSPSGNLMTVEELKARGKKQLDIELKGDIEIANINFSTEPSTTVLKYREILTETEKEWRVVIRDAFIRNLSTLKSQSYASQNAISMYPYLKVLKVDQYVELIMGEMSKLVDGSETYSPMLKLLQRDLGTQVYNRYKIEQYHENGVFDKIAHLYEKYCDWYVNRSIDGSAVPYNARQAWQMLVHNNRDGANLDADEAQWPMEIRQNVGKFLYNIIINDVKIDVNMFKAKPTKQKKLPAVYRVHRPWGRLFRLELKPHPALSRLWAGAAPCSLRMRAPLLPAAAPPAPWAAPDGTPAAYLLTHTPLVRLPFNVVQQWKRLEEAPTPSLYPVLDSLNQLGEIPWVINKPVLDIQLEVFRSGGNKKLDIAPPPSALDTSSFGCGESKAEAFKRRIAINRARSDMYSLWCDALYKLSLANHYRDEVFWLPHNMDFRGRVYACPPHLSQLGPDSSRALLLFAAKRPLGPDGLMWLKLHAINLTGSMKKSTVEQRMGYANSIMNKILDSAENPMSGEMWWTQSEEPWQTLACCKEIANAVRSPNPEEYLCGFPVHQDGSCNGLQHYAALGGDAAGAAAVNLDALQSPQDVYSAVAALVEEMRAKDAANGIVPARVLENFVRRKVIKQTVMTTVYGVTKFGARLQIAKQLKDIDTFPKEHVWSCSNYLTVKTFDSLREMFTSTKHIQDWFTECAKLISGVCGESVEWVTPLGLPVVQPYFKRPPPASLHAANNAPVDHHQRPCTMKQKNAFPPNFIHSLDSTHMMLTGLHCQAKPLTFISVHDCFWTHPDTVHIMNKICREQFVALHSQPILDDLSQYLTARYSYAEKDLDDECNATAAKRQVNSLLQRVPKKGDFKLQNVLNSVYFFS